MSTYLYRVPEVGPRWPEHFPSGTYRDEEDLVASLRAFSDRHGLPRGLSVHVYETDDTPLAIGRTRLGTVEARAVLRAGEVDLARVRS